MLLRALSSAGGSAYLVRLSGQFGELMLVETFATFDQAYAKTLTDHINNAVRARKSGIFAGNAATSSRASRRSQPTRRLPQAYLSRNWLSTRTGWCC